MIKVKAYEGDKLVADYLFEHLIDAMMFAAGMRKKNYKVEFENSE